MNSKFHSAYSGIQELTLGVEFICPCDGVLLAIANVDSACTLTHKTLNVSFMCSGGRSTNTISLPCFKGDKVSVTQNVGTVYGRFMKFN